MYPLLSGVFLFVYMMPKLLLTYQSGQRYLSNAVSIFAGEELAVS